MIRSTEPSQDALRFLQSRVGRFGLLAGSLCLVFWVYRTLTIEIVGSGREDHLHPSMLAHLASALCLGALWVVLRGPQRSARAIRLIEAVGVISGCSLLIVMGSYIPLLARPDMILVMALTIVLMSRAVYVPSSGRHTALIGIAVGVAMIAVVYRSVAAGDPRIVQLLGAGEGLTAGQVGRAAALSTAVWWSLSTALAVIASRVIYGLRKQVGAIKQLGQYRIEGKLGAGGMGVVYKASHAMLRRETAVKLLPPERAGASALARFEREVKLTARLRHPNTVTVYDYGRTPEGTLYYAMELLEGATLEQVVRTTGPLPASRVVHVLEHVAGALAEAHGLGLIHRDIKPANIMLCNQGGEQDVVKVLDFGLVKELSSDEPNVTQANSITGTPLYISPEALKDPDSVSARSDLYALGAVAYYLLVGEHVFSAKTLVEICSKHLTEAPVPPSQRTRQPIPEQLERLVLACLSKEPSERPESARALAQLARETVTEMWSSEQAESWWQEHGDALARRRVSESGSDQTIAVDWLERQRASPPKVATSASR